MNKVNSLLLPAINVFFNVSLSWYILFSLPLTPFLPLSPGWPLVACCLLLIKEPNLVKVWSSSVPSWWVLPAVPVEDTLLV